MTFLFARFQVDDYEAWKQGRFDADPAGRKEAAKSHRIYRSLDNPREVFVQVEFDSADTARKFRERLLGSGALDGIDVLTPPQLVEEADSARY
jgi:hypothetical protein